MGDFEDERDYPLLLQFYTSERINTLALWEAIFRNASSSHTHAPYFEQFISIIFPSKTSTDFALSLLPLPESPIERSSTLKILFFMYYTVFPAPSIDIILKIKDTLLIKANDMQVLVVLCILPQQAFEPCHPAIDLQSACILSQISPTQVNLQESINWFVNANYTKDIETYAKSIFRQIFNQTCDAFQETETMLPWFIKIYKEEQILIEDYWKSDFKDAFKRDVLDVWKRRFPVNNEFLKGLESVLCVSSAMEVFQYFERVESVTDYASNRYDYI